MQEAQRYVRSTHLPIAYTKPAPAPAASTPVYTASTDGPGMTKVEGGVRRAALLRSAMEDGSALARDFPSVASLTRDDWQALLAESLDPTQHADQVRLYEAVVHSLPSVRAMYEEHEALLRRIEQAAGTCVRLTQR